MGIRVIRSSTTKALSKRLAEELAATPSDPFASELVIVPTRGIERYLTQTIADRNGICANIAFPSPREFLELVAGEDQDPWTPDRLAWPLLAVIDASLAEPWCAPVAAHLRDDPNWRRSDRRFAVASRLAGLFASYATERPAMVAAWDAGEPADVPDDLIWQYQLWRALRRELGCGPFDGDMRTHALPGRLSVFGPTRLPERFLSVLRALAPTHQIDLYLPVASPSLWDGPGWSTDALRRDDDSRDQVNHPLLGSLGRDARELRIRLGHAGETAPATGQEGTSTLARLQAQIAANAVSTLNEAPPDKSLQFHSCHGALRQVEVLREVVLGLLHEHSDLQPRDVLIMTPDLDTFAPLLSAVFGDPDPRIARLRLSVADRTPEQHNEVLVALDALLRLLGGRMKRSEVLDFLKLAPVRERFGMSSQDVSRIEELAGSAGVRWGLDQDHRGEYGLADVDLGTWSWGLDRIVLGTAMSDEGLQVFADVLPLPDVSSGDVGLVGSLATILDRLGELRRASRASRSMKEWRDLLQEAIEAFTDARFAKSWQTAHALGAIESFVIAAGDHAGSVPLALADIRHLLAAVLAGRPTRSGFRLGGITACQLAPMRSVPYRVICLLGMDDGAFPRKAGRDGDDVLLREPMIGERDPRSEDRQLFLDAIMAAEDHLVITYTGRDERTNQERQPAVPLAELLDLFPHPSPVREHALQPFDPCNFVPSDPFSHDEAALAGARASVGERIAEPFLGAPLPPPDPPPVRSLDSLAKFLKEPAATFFHQRLRLHLRDEDADPSEALPMEVHPLDRYQIGERLLDALLSGSDGSAVVEAQRRAGLVPPGKLGAAELDEISAAAGRVQEHYLRFIDGRSKATLEFPLDLGDGVAAAITVPDVAETTIVRATFAKVKVKQVLGIWPQLLALAAAFPDRSWSAKIAAQEGDIELSAPAAQEASDILNRLFTLQVAALTSPPPVAPQTAFAYASARGKGEPRVARQRAVKDWQRERSAQAMVILFGPHAPLEALFVESPLPGEGFPGEDTRFGSIARHIFGPILDQDARAGIRNWPKARS